MIRASASAMPRLLLCPGSAHLRQADYQSAHANAGDERHAEAESAADTGGELDRRVQALIRPGDELAAECSFAYDVSDDTGRGLGHLAKRDYRDLRPFEIPGTVDLLIRGNSRVCVVDYKSFEDVEPAATNAQLATYALMVARAAGVDEVTVAVVYLATPWRPADIATLYAFDLDAHADRLRALMVGGDKSLHVNRHCKYCPSFHDCPEQAQLASDAGGGALAMRVEAMIPFAQDDEAADAYELMKRIGILYGRVKAALVARATERPIPLRSGKMFGRVHKSGNEKLDGDVVYEVVKAHHGQELADAAVVRTATKKRLGDVLKGKRGAVLTVLKEVKVLGGISQKASEAIEEYDPGLKIVTDEEPKQLEPPF